jgi:hypothetical protein
MKNNIIKTLSLIVAIGIITSCEQDDPEVELAAVNNLSGEWFIQYEYEDNGAWVNPGWGHYKVITSNTAANLESEMMINDQDGWGIQYKVNVNGLTFSANGTADLVGGTSDVTVTNGLIIQKGGFSTSGVVTDSIAFEFTQPNDDPTLYRASGVRRTGFLEDEH